MNNKVLGAKEMFRQSIVYLYNGYRDEGLSAKEAKAKVAEDVEAIYEEYVESGAMPPKSVTGIADPIRIVDESLREIQFLKNVKMHSNERIPFKHRIDTITRNLKHLKTLLK